MARKTANTKKNAQKAYVQFSKKMVVFVNVAVTAITLLAMVFAFIAENMVVIQHIVESYIGFATVCFAAYSGNSAIEKWLIKKYSAEEDKDKDEEKDEEEAEDAEG